MIRVVLKDIIEKPITGEWGNEGASVGVLRTTNFTNEGFIDYTKVIKRDIEQKKIDKKRLFKGDLIIEKSGGSPTQPVGRVVYFDNEDIFLCNNFTAILRPKKEQVFPKYLHYILFVGHQFGLTSAFQNKTTGIINLQLTKYLEGIQIPLPPLPQQEKIAAILDVADAIRQNDKTLIAKYDELTQALFLDKFGDPFFNDRNWIVNNLENLCYLITKGTTPKGVDLYDKYNSGLVPFLKVYHINNVNEIDFSYKPSFVSLNTHKNQLKRSIVYPNDVLMNIVGPPLGKIALVVNSLGECNINQAIAFFRCKVKLNPIYLFHCLSNKNLLSNIIDQAIGVRQQNISLKQCREIKIPVPPIELQNQFAERITLIEEQKAIAQKTLERSDELFNSLLQKAFKGELV